jgi:Bacteriophage head to tail connecting protein
MIDYERNNSLVADIVTDERNARNGLTTKWIELWNLYRTKPLRVQGDDGWQSKLNDGRVFEIIETVGAYFRIALFYSDNWVELESREPGLGDVVPLASTYFRDCLNASNLWRELRVATTQLLLTGFSAMRVYWNNDDDCLAFESLNACDVYIESGRRYDPKLSYVFREYQLTEAEFVDWANSDMFNELADDAADAFHRYSTYRRNTQGNWIHDTGQVSSSEVVEVVEFYDPIDGCLYRCVEDVLLHEEEGIKECPWLISCLFETPNEAYGASIVDSSIGLILENNILMNRRLDNIAVSVDNMWLFVDDGATDPSQIRTRPGAVITVARPDVLQPLHPPSNNFNVTYQEASVLDTKIDRNIGTGAMISANTYRSGERVTAQEIQSVKEAGGNRLTDVYELYEKCFIVPLLKQAYKLVRENTTKAKVVKRKGSRPNVYDYFKVLPDDLRADYGFRVTASQNVINRDRNISLITEFVTLVGSVPQFAELVDWGAMFQDLLMKFGFDDPARYLKPVQEAPAPAPANPMEAMSQGLGNIGGQAYEQALQEKVSGGGLPAIARTMMGQPPPTEPDPAEDAAISAGMMIPTGTPL